jgi:hypothetical protein
LGKSFRPLPQRPVQHGQRLDCRHGGAGGGAEGIRPVCPFSTEEVVELRKHGSVGGAEHEVFVPETLKDGPLVWKFTRPGRWGLIRATPLEYLLRLERLNKVSGTHILIQGIAITSDDIPIIVSSMDYVHGRHPQGSELHKRLCNEGWELISDPDNMLSYRHKVDGTVMRDAHAKNFILT